NAAAMVFSRFRNAIDRVAGGNAILFSLVQRGMSAASVSSDLPEVMALTCAKAAVRRAGCHIPANAPNSDKTAETPIAGANPALKVRGELRLPLPAKTATAIAIPETPPRKRSMLKVPDALPISVCATELKTALWAAGIAMETPAPATISGATRVA